MITYWLLYGTIVFYSIVDAVQTKMLLDMGATELNPVLNYLIDGSGSVYAIFAFKAFWLILMFVLLVFKSKEIRNQYYRNGDNIDGE